MFRFLKRRLRIICYYAGRHKITDHQKEYARPIKNRNKKCCANCLYKMGYANDEIASCPIGYKTHQNSPRFVCDKFEHKDKELEEDIKKYKFREV